jgi:glyoxylate/hydroxypyruvate reductase A
MVKVYFAAGRTLWQQYQTLLPAALAEHGLTAEFSAECDAPGDVDYIIYAPGAEATDFAAFTRCKAVLSLWAGVEKIVGTPGLTQPLCRMVNPARTAGMVEWVVGHALRHHLGMDRHILNPDRIWEPTCPPLAAERPVTVLGLGALGQACAHALQGIGFPVTGWSRSEKQIDGLTCEYGEDGLNAALSTAQILVLLLPRTAETENLLNARRLAMLPGGAAILNPGRGHLIDDAALLAALNTGALGHATLDVFRTEPLPQDHPFWQHPQITVTPHVAAETRPASAAGVIAENIRRGEANLPFLHLVDRQRGY